MKVTVQYYDKDPKAKVDAVAKVAEGLIIETERPDFQTIAVADKLAAKDLIKKLSPIANIQTQTAP